MNESEIIKDLVQNLNLTDLGLKKHIKKYYPDTDGRSIPRLIREARNQIKQRRCEIQPPIDLEDDELEVWIDVWDRLDRSSIEPVDHITLANYCQSKAMYYRLHTQVLELPNDGIMFVGKSDYPQMHPKVTMRDKAEKRCVEIEKLFGFNPKGRKELGMQKKKDDKQAQMRALLHKPKVSNGQ